MKVALVCVFFVLLGCCAARSQTFSSNSTSNNQSSITAASRAKSGNSNAGQNSNREEKKNLRGCIESQNGKVVLQEKQSKKMIPLANTRDFTPFVGRAVAVHGVFDNSQGYEKNIFLVSRMETLPDSCAPERKQVEQAANGKPSPYHK